MPEKQYIFAVGQHITIVVQANNVPNAWQALKDLGVDVDKVTLAIAWQTACPR